MIKDVIIHGDCLEKLREIADNSIDAVVTDPPYGLSKEPDIREVLTKWMNGEDYHHRGGGFMGKTWDSFVPGPSIWKEVFRVLKPGGHLLCFAGTRTQDLMTISLRLAGFEIRDCISWLFFSGFPKSMDVGKAFDKRVGAEREVIGFKAGHGKNSTLSRAKQAEQGYRPNGKNYGEYDGTGKAPITLPATDLAKKWDGWGTALKPAHEPIIMARKPIEKNVAYNVEKWGCGALNIDGCRIGEGTGIIRQRKAGSEFGQASGWNKHNNIDSIYDGTKGRFPANCVTLEEDAFYSKYFNITPPELSKKASKKDRNSDWRGEEISLPLRDKTPGKGSTYKSHDINGSGKPTNGTGKVAPTRNHHPTVKPVPLMSWLIKLICPPGGIVLDPFAGSGSTLVAAKREGFSFIGIEREKEYVEIARARLGQNGGEAQ